MTNDNIEYNCTPQGADTAQFIFVVLSFSTKVYMHIYTTQKN